MGSLLIAAAMAGVAIVSQIHYSPVITFVLVIGTIAMAVIVWRDRINNYLPILFFILYVGYLALSPELTSSPFIRDADWRGVLASDAALGLAGFALVWAVIGRRVKENVADSGRSLNADSMLLAALVCLIAGSAAFAQSVGIIGAGQFFSTSRSALSQLYHESRGIIPATPFISFGTIALALGAMKMNKRSVLGWLVVSVCVPIVILYFGFLVIGGDRSALIRILVPLALIVAGVPSRRTLPWLFAAMFIVMALMSSLSFIRGPMRQTISTGDMAPLVQRLSAVQARWLVPREFISIPLSQVHVRLFGDDSNGGPLAAPNVLLDWVPRSIYLGENAPSMSRYFGSAMGEASGHRDPYSVSFSVIAESILYFGQIGPLIFGGVCAILVGLTSKFRFNPYCGPGTLFILTCSPVVIVLFRSSIGGNITFVIYNVFILFSVLIGIFIYKRLLKTPHVFIFKRV